MLIVFSTATRLEARCPRPHPAAEKTGNAVSARPGESNEEGNRTGGRQCRSRAAPRLFAASCPFRPASPGRRQPQCT